MAEPADPEIPQRPADSPKVAESFDAEKRSTPEISVPVLAGACDAVANDATSIEAMTPYLQQHISALASQFQ